MKSLVKKNKFFLYKFCISLESISGGVQDLYRVCTTKNGKPGGKILRSNAKSKQACGDTFIGENIPNPLQAIVKEGSTNAQIRKILKAISKLSCANPEANFKKSKITDLGMLQPVGNPRL